MNSEKSRPVDQDDDKLFSLFAIIYVIYDFIKSALYHFEERFKQTKIYLQEKIIKQVPP